LAAALFATTGLAGCMKTATYGTGQAPEMALFREMTGGLLSREKKAPIQYQARAPLVAPPSTASLPPPVASAEVASAEWPLDPDQQSRDGVPYGDDTPRDDIDQAEYRRLKPLAGVLPAAQTDETWTEENQPAYAIVGNKKQREQFDQALADMKGFNRTERRYLTDPPLTYREPAASAPTEFENLKGDKGFFLTRWLTGG
jgi:hypothetical protein